MRVYYIYHNMKVEEGLREKRKRSKGTVEGTRERIRVGKRENIGCFLSYMHTHTHTHTDLLEGSIYCQDLLACLYHLQFVTCFPWNIQKLVFLSIIEFSIIWYVFSIKLLQFAKPNCIHCDKMEATDVCQSYLLIWKTSWMRFREA